MDKISEKIKKLAEIKRQLDDLLYEGASQDELDDNYICFNIILKELKQLYRKETYNTIIYNISEEDRKRRSENMKKIRYKKR